MSDNLLPCPFCGGKAQQPAPQDPHGGMVQCVSCGASAFGPKWNRRTPPKPSSEPTPINDPLHLRGSCEDPSLTSAGYVVCGSAGDTRWHWHGPDKVWHDGFKSESAAVNSALRDLAAREIP